ncbi:YeeE/YedE family protein [Oceanobacter kriegii]|uniref:YeeE/YedE family protein n=1 Tax=Oceanobacter kriegii TaxID=64972 RepID=UPI000415DFC1|nr:YeeE/YedE thiosulfate transporter family protein [Oceanobacter kriegii]
MIAEFIGGALIGLAAIWLWLANGRISGMTGVISSCFSWIGRGERNRLWAVCFAFGLILSMPVLLMLGYMPEAVDMTSHKGLIIAGGLLVGVGTYVANGCTSGHGVCGMGRMSLRSVVATLVFMGFAILTVAVMAQVQRLMEAGL